MKVKTKDLDWLLKTVVNAAGKINIMPITSSVTLFVEDNQLYACATNRIDTLFGHIDVEDKKDFKATVDIITLQKLVHSLTTDEVELNMKKDYLQIVANGKYKLMTLVDGRGTEIHIDDTRFKPSAPPITINADVFSTIKSQLSISLAEKSFVEESYKDYYIGEVALTTNTDNASMLRVSPFNSEKYKVYAKTIELLSLFEGQIEMSQDFSNKRTMFSGNNLCLVTSMLELDRCPNFEAEAFVEIFNERYDYSVECNKKDFIEVLNRFGVLCQQNITINLNNGILFTSSDDTFEEKLDIPCHIDKIIQINYVVLLKYLKTIDSDTFTLSFKDDLIKLTGKNVEHILSEYI